MNTPALLAANGLSFSRNDEPVFGPLDFHVDAGEALLVQGGNGAGKTTLLRTALGLVRPRAGAVLVDGRTMDRAASRTVGYVPQRQEFAWGFPISVHDAVLSGRTALRGLWRRSSAEDFEATSQALERVRLTDLADRPVGELSGGQRQRVLVARALATRPRVLLLDEPYTGLDLPSQELLDQLFRSLAADGESLLMTTHDLGSAVASCDRIYLLRGSIVASGRPEELRDARLWTEVFGVSASSPLLTAVGAR